MTVCIGDVRAEGNSVKECRRRLLTLMNREPIRHVLEHIFEERCSRTAVRAIEYQNPPIPLPAVPSVINRAAIVPNGNTPSLQPCIRGNKPLDSALDTLLRMSSVQEPCDPGMSGILNGLASSRPAGLSQALFERLWQRFIESKAGSRSQEHPGELHGQRRVLVLVRSRKSWRSGSALSWPGPRGLPHRVLPHPSRVSDPPQRSWKPCRG